MRRVLQVVGIETEKVSKEKAVADEEEQKVAAIAVVVSGKQRDCEEDLAKAEPALLAAQDALNTLNKVSHSRDISLRLIDLLRHRLPRLSSLFKCSFSPFDLVFFFFLPFPSLFPKLQWNKLNPSQCLELYKRLLNHRLYPGFPTKNDVSAVFGAEFDFIPHISPRFTSSLGDFQKHPVCLKGARCSNKQNRQFNRCSELSKDALISILCCLLKVGAGSPFFLLIRLPLPSLKVAPPKKNTLHLTAPPSLVTQNNLTELKSFGSPVVAVTNVTAAVMVLMAPGGKVPKDRSWKAAKVTMAKVDAFLDSLMNFNKENIPEACLKAIQPYLQVSFCPCFIFKIFLFYIVGSKPCILFCIFSSCCKCRFLLEVNKVFMCLFYLMWTSQIH